MSSTETKTDKAAEEVVLLDSLQQPAWHVVVLSFFTLGAYNMFWLYRSLRTLLQQSQYMAGITPLDSGEELAVGETAPPTAAELAGSKSRLEEAGTLEAFLQFTQTRPIFTTFLFAIPILNMVVLMGFAYVVAQMYPDQNSLARKNPKLVAFALALAFGALTLLNRLPEPYHLLYLSSALPLFVVQTWLNRHWKVVENNSRIARQAFSPLELLAIVAGAAWIGLVVVHTDLKM